MGPVTVEEHESRQDRYEDQLAEEYGVDIAGKASEEKLALLNEARTTLSDAFKALSAETLKSNNQQFLQLARTTRTRGKPSATCPSTSSRTGARSTPKSPTTFPDRRRRSSSRRTA